MDPSTNQRLQGSSRLQGNSAAGVERLLSLRKFDHALVMCRHLLEGDQDSAELHQLAGIAALALDELTTARHHLARSLQLDPEDAVTLYQLSRFWDAKKRPRESEAAIQRAISLVPYVATYWAHLAWIYYQEGDSERARQPAERALALAPDDPHVGSIHAMVLAQCRDGTQLDLPAQEARLLEILKLDPEDHAVQHNTGLFYLHEMGDYAKAIQHLSTAVMLEPTDQTTRAALVKALRRADPFLKWLYLPHHGVVALKAAQRWASQRHWRYSALALSGFFLLVPTVLLLVFWAIGIWPLAKAYEFLTVAELRERMKVNGHPGIFRIHYWPRSLRLVALIISYALFWLGLATFWGSPLVKVFLGLAISLVMMELTGVSLSDHLRQIREDWKKR